MAGVWVECGGGRPMYVWECVFGGCGRVVCVCGRTADGCRKEKSIRECGRRAGGRPGGIASAGL